MNLNTKLNFREGSQQLLTESNGQLLDTIQPWKPKTVVIEMTGLWHFALDCLYFCLLKWEINFQKWKNKSIN